MNSLIQKQVFDTEASYNVDVLEGALLHILQVCGCLSAVSLDRFARIYALQRGKALKQKADVSHWLLPQMNRAKSIFQLDNGKYYAISPTVPFDRKMQDAFWVFLEHMKDAPLQSVGQGPIPAQISYHRNGNDYHIISVEENGERELKLALEFEMMIEHAKRSYNEADSKANHTNKYPEDRFIVIFESEDYMRTVAYILKSRTMYGVLNYIDDTGRAQIRFYDPAKVR